MQQQNSFEENFRKSYDRFYDEFSKYDSMFRFSDSIARMEEGAKDYAMFGLKNILWLNSGALVLMPAILAMSNHTFNLYFGIAALVYTTGIISTAFSILYAYFGFNESAIMLYAARDKHHANFTIRNLGQFYDDDTKSEFAKASNNSEELETIHRAKCIKNNKIAEYLAIGGLFTLVIASGLVFGAVLDIF